MCGHSNMHGPLWVHSECIEMRIRRASYWDGGIWSGHCGVILNPISYFVWFSNLSHILLEREHIYLFFLHKANSHLGGDMLKNLLSLLGHLGSSKNQNHGCGCLCFLPDRKCIQALAQAQMPETSGFTVFNTWAPLICWLRHPHYLC